MGRLQRCGILLFAVLLFALDNILLKALPVGTSPFGVLVLACTFAAPVLTVLFRFRLHTDISAADRIRIIVLAAGFTLFNILNIVSLKYLSVNESAFLFSLTVACVPFINLFLGKRFHWTVWAGVVFIIGGVWFASGVTYRGTHTLGALISIAGAVIRSFFLVGLNRLSKRMDNGRILVEIIWFVALFAAALWLIREPAGLLTFQYNAKTILPILCFSLLSIVIANSMVILIQKYATAVETAVILSVQLVFTVILMSIIPSVFESPEPLTTVHAFGCLLIICGSILATADICKSTKPLKRHH